MFTIKENIFKSKNFDVEITDMQSTIEYYQKHHNLKLLFHLQVGNYQYGDYINALYFLYKIDNGYSLRIRYCCYDGYDGEERDTENKFNIKLDFENKLELIEHKNNLSDIFKTKYDLSDHFDFFECLIECFD